MTLKYPTIVAATALMVGLTLPRASTAQQGQSRHADSVKVDDALLQKFVTVYPEVSRIEKQVRQKLASSSKPADSRTFRLQAQKRIRQVFREDGMTMTKYQAVVRKLNADPDLMRKFRSMLNAKNDSTGGGGGLI